MITVVYDTSRLLTNLQESIMVPGAWSVDPALRSQEEVKEARTNSGIPEKKAPVQEEEESNGKRRRRNK